MAGALRSVGPGVAGLAIVLAGNFAARWPFRSALLITDEGEYAQLGQQILLGAIPYLDIYSQKTPFVFYFAASVQAAFGESLEAFRLATTVYGTVTAVMVFLIARRALGTIAAPFAALAFCVMTFDQCGVIHSASTEFFLLLWLAAGVLLAISAGDRHSAWRWVAAGACAGVACQTKQTGAALLVFLLANRLWTGWGAESDGSPLRGLARDGAAIVLGFAAVTAAPIGLFAIQGGLAAYIECAWANNLEYVGARQQGIGGALTLLGVVLVHVARWDAVLWAAGAAGLLAVARRPGPNAAPAGGLWLLLAMTLAMGLASGNAYVHYWEPMILPIALGVGAAFAWLRERWEQAAERPALRTALLAAGILPWIAPLGHAAPLLASPRASLDALYQSLPPMALAPAVGAYLTEQTSENEPVLVIGSEPQIYYHARRPAASRMVFTFPLTGPYSFASRALAEYVDALRDDGPRYVVLVTYPSSLSEYGEGSLRLLRKVSPILLADYAVERVFPESRATRPHRLGAYPAERIVVLRRKDS